MKKITLLIVLIFISTHFPQKTDEIKPSIKNFYTELNNIVAHYDMKLGMQKKFSNDELFNTAKLLYIATEDDPVAFRKELKSEYDAWAAETIKNNYKPIGLKPGVKLGILHKLIDERYGKNFTKILEIPYYLKVKILDIQGTIYIHTDKNTFHQINLICSVEDVIKGEKKFKKEDIITVSFLLHWFPEGYPSFEKGNSYFIPVDYWKIDNEIEAFCLGILHNAEKSAVLSLNENKLIDAKNCYLLDSTKTWEIFKRNFLKKYKLN